VTANCAVLNIHFKSPAPGPPITDIDVHGAGAIVIVDMSVRLSVTRWLRMLGS